MAFLFDADDTALLAMFLCILNSDIEAGGAPLDLKIQRSPCKGKRRRAKWKRRRRKRRRTGQVWRRRRRRRRRKTGRRKR
jgi:hypothetical protein